MAKRVLMDLAIVLALALIGLVLYDFHRLNNICRVAPQVCWGIPPTAPPPASTQP